jgi:hypothetical protein
MAESGKSKEFQGLTAVASVLWPTLRNARIDTGALTALDPGRMI